MVLKCVKVNFFIKAEDGYCQYSIKIILRQPNPYVVGYKLVAVSPEVLFSTPGGGGGGGRGRERERVSCKDRHP